MPEIPSDPDHAMAQAAQDQAASAELQDNLLGASHELDRLQRLLSDATQTLINHFCGASTQISQLAHMADPCTDVPAQALHQAMQHLGGAITALQFQDMASQLIVHTNLRLLRCAFDLSAVGRDIALRDERNTVSRLAPLPLPAARHASPVAQDQMRAGSIELF